MSYSFSQIKTVYECPFKYKYLYVDHLKMPGNVFALFGQAIHAVFKDIIADGLDRKNAMGLWEGYFELEICKGEEIIVIKNYDYWLKRGYPVIQTFFNIKEKFDIQTIVKIEERSKAIYEGNEFSYICDLVYKNSKNELVMLDYKTGKHKVIDFYQLIFYVLLMGMKFDKLCLFYIWDEPLWFDINEYLEETKKYIDNGIKLIKGGVYSKNPNKYCKTCYLSMKGFCK